MTKQATISVDPRTKAFYQSPAEKFVVCVPTAAADLEMPDDPREYRAPSVITLFRGSHAACEEWAERNGYRLISRPIDRAGELDRPAQSPSDHY